MRPTILIVSSFYEPNVNEVVARLEQRGVPWFRLNTETLPLVARASLRVDEAGACATLHCDGRDVSTADVSAVWYRRVGEPLLPRVAAPEIAEFIRGETFRLLGGVLAANDARWVNPAHEEEQASNKLYQLRIATECGLRVPKTLATNDVTHAREFFYACGRRVLFKPIGSALRTSRVEQATNVLQTYAGKFALPPAPGAAPAERIPVFFSRVLESSDEHLLDRISGCPVTLQEYVPKRYELRVTIVGQRCFAAAIFSQEREATRIDWRHLALVPAAQRPRHEALQLPIDVEEKLHRVMKRLGLIFGCFDLIVTPDGEYVFLEVNPSGQWGWVEGLTGLPITAALVDLLCDQRGG